jgi:hypothetical protein
MIVAGGDVDLLGLGHDVDGARAGVDHRRAGDPDLRHNVGGAHVAVGDRARREAGDRRDQEIVPEDGAVIGVQGAVG